MIVVVCRLWLLCLSVGLSLSEGRRASVGKNPRRSEGQVVEIPTKRVRDKSCLRCSGPRDGNGLEVLGLSVLDVGGV